MTIDANIQKDYADLQKKLDAYIAQQDGNTHIERVDALYDKIKQRGGIIGRDNLIRLSKTHNDSGRCELSGNTRARTMDTLREFFKGQSNE